MKKGISIILSLLLLFCMQSIAFAGEFGLTKYEAVYSALDIANELKKSLGLIRSGFFSSQNRRCYKYI